MDELFDGRFLKQVTAAGGRFVSTPGSLLTFHPRTGLLPWRHNPDPMAKTRVLFATRHLVESTTRRLLADNPRVQMMYEAAVTGLVFGSQQEEGGGGGGSDKAVRAGVKATEHGRVSG